VRLRAVTCSVTDVLHRWCGICAFSGFYLANTVSLSFGALAVNDIVAAALAVAFVETVTRTFYAAWPDPYVAALLRSAAAECSPRQALLALAAALLQGAMRLGFSRHSWTETVCAARVSVCAHSRLVQARRLSKWVRPWLQDEGD